MTKVVDERVARRQYMRRRQTVVFSILAAVMTVALIVSCAFYFHVFGLGLVQSPAVKPNYGVTAPCAPADSTGKKPTYVDTKQVAIRVLNGTTSSGLAKAVGDALQNRNFNVTSISNYAGANAQRTTIYFGANAIAQAYTLNSNFTDAVMVMDNRSDRLVDVVVGATFNNLQLKKDVPGTGETIKSFTGCVPTNKMGKLPKALPHTNV